VPRAAGRRHDRERRADRTAQAPAIPESCYIDDTGHFNAVEFNICFNQLAYVLFGKCVDAGILQKLRHEKVNVISFPDYKLHRLPSMLHFLA
jgi:hypothetical protein